MRKRTEQSAETGLVLQASPCMIFSCGGSKWAERHVAEMFMGRFTMSFERELCSHLSDTGDKGFPFLASGSLLVQWEPGDRACSLGEKSSGEDPWLQLVHTKFVIIDSSQNSAQPPFYVMICKELRILPKAFTSFNHLQSPTPIETEKGVPYYHFFRP